MFLLLLLSNPKKTSLLVTWRYGALISLAKPSMDGRRTFCAKFWATAVVEELEIMDAL
jgi:hypothetical protein